VVVDAEVKGPNKTTRRSERSSVLKKGLTGSALLEMSGYVTVNAFTAASHSRRLAISAL
jgi:hypothetical protein